MSAGDAMACAACVAGKGSHESDCPAAPPAAPAPAEGSVVAWSAGAIAAGIDPSKPPPCGSCGAIGYHAPTCDGVVRPPKWPGSPVTVTTAPAPAAAPAEALTMERYTRTVAQSMFACGDNEDLAVRDGMALLTPRARLELAAELVAPLPPEERRRFAAGLLRGLPSRDGESALAQVLRVCGDVAVDEASLVPLPPGPHAAAVITGAEAAHEMLQEPARVLALLAELVALLPSGPPGARLLLGVGAEAHAAIAALPGATRWVTPHVIDNRVVTIPGARVRVGALVVEAQGEAQPVELPGVRS